MTDDDNTIDVDAIDSTEDSDHSQEEYDNDLSGAIERAHYALDALDESVEREDDMTMAVGFVAVMVDPDDDEDIAYPMCHHSTADAFDEMSAEGTLQVVNAFNTELTNLAFDVGLRDALDGGSGMGLGDLLG